MGGRSVAIALPVLQGRVTPRQLQGGRFNRPNDVICHSNGCLYFTDPEKRRPYQERQIPGPAGEDNLWDGARVYRLAPDGGLSVLANCEYPNGLALSPLPLPLVRACAAYSGRRQKGVH